MSLTEREQEIDKGYLMRLFAKCFGRISPGMREAVANDLLRATERDKQQLREELYTWKSKFDSAFSDAHSYFVRTEVLEAELEVVNRRANFAEQEQDQLRQENERLKEALQQIGWGSLGVDENGLYIQPWERARQALKGDQS